MCLAIPMRVLSGGQLVAWCEGRGERRQLDLALIGAQPEGTWVVAFRDVARQVLTGEEAAALNLALDGLEAALRGETANLDAYFPDLVGRSPEPPEAVAPSAAADDVEARDAPRSIAARP
jgi:hydrogenase expression/formation protein HypC